MKITLLGIGNILMKDDGAGVRAIEYLQRNYSFPENVRLIDAGTTIFHNMSILSECGKLIVLDAVNLDGEPGTVYTFSPDEYQIKLPRKASSHDVGFLHTFATMRLLDQEPPETLIVGVQPKDYGSWGENLSPEIEAKIPEIAELAINQLRKWGVEAMPICEKVK